MTKLEKVIESYFKDMKDVVKKRNENRANTAVWFNRSTQIDGQWVNNSIKFSQIQESLDDNYIVNMFIKDIDNADDAFTETVELLADEKLMLAEGTKYECQNSTSRYMVVSTEE
jgi:hypothetical protein